MTFNENMTVKEFDIFAWEFTTILATFDVRLCFVMVPSIGRVGPAADSSVRVARGRSFAKWRALWGSPRTPGPW